MQKGRVLSLRTFGLSEFLKNNYFFITVILIFTVGFFIGNFGFNNIELLKNHSNDFIDNYISLRNGAGFGSVFLKSLLEYLSLLFILFLLGASLFGVITVPTVIFVKGIIQGGISAFLYSEYGLKGIAFNAVIIIPPTLIFLIILLISSRESVRFSIKLSSLTLSKTLPFNLSTDFRDYTLKYLALAIGCIICGLIDAIISSGLIKHFIL